MTTQNRLLKISVPASADLSSNQYKVHKMNSSGEAVLMATISNIPLGILQNKPDAQGKPCDIAPMGAGGISKIRLGATLAKGVLVASGSDGRAVADASTNFTLGLLLEGGDANDIGSVLMAPMTAVA